jgi:hypothetical protein
MMRGVWTYILCASGDGGCGSNEPRRHLPVMTGLFFFMFSVSPEGTSSDALRACKHLEGNISREM